MAKLNTLSLFLLLTLLGAVFTQSTSGNTTATSEETPQPKEEDQDKEEEEEVVEELPIPTLKTVESCKGDCTAEWSDCVYGCPESQSSCYKGCQTGVKKCLDECPSVICNDHCSIELELCQRKEEPEKCEQPFYDCQETCDNVYIGRTDL